MFWIRDILVRIRIPTNDLRIRTRIWILLFRQWLTSIPQKISYFSKWFCLLLFECTGTFTSVFEDKMSKGSQRKRRNQSFLYFFCLLMQGSGSVQNNEGSGSGRPKIIKNRIHNTGYWFVSKPELQIVSLSLCFTLQVLFLLPFPPVPRYECSGSVPAVRRIRIRLFTVHMRPLISWN